MSFFNYLDSDARFQNFFDINKHLKVLQIKDFIKFGARTTGISLLELALFNFLFWSFFGFFRKDFFARIINLDIFFHKTLILDARNDHRC